ncbi:hypothetical protein EI94DRAFT_1705975 [Lactarius quietus]|nr:hypothetical protein EI94DRAFT_1705975 [Lactarius quietus]
MPALHGPLTLTSSRLTPLALLGRLAWFPRLPLVEGNIGTPSTCAIRTCCCDQIAAHPTRLKEMTQQRPLHLSELHNTYTRQWGTPGKRGKKGRKGFKEEEEAKDAAEKRRKAMEEAPSC